MYALGVQAFVIGHVKERLEYVASKPRSTGITSDAKSISAAGNFYVEAAFDLSDMLIELTAEVGETTVVGGFQDDVPGYRRIVQV